MSGWAIAGQAAADIGGSLLGGWQKSKQARAQMKYQYHLNRKLFRNRYQDTMWDMRKAGLNPILAAGQSVSAPSVGGGADPGDMGLSSLSGTAKRVLETQQTKANVDNTKQNTNTQRAAELEQLSQDVKNTAQAGEARQNVEESRKRQQRESASARELDQRIKESNERIKYMGTEGGAFGIPKDVIHEFRDWARQRTTSAKKWLENEDE